MKTKILSLLNVLLTFVLGLLGFQSCDVAKKYGPGPEVEYGAPYAEYDVSGTITDEEEKPLKNMQIKLKENGVPIAPETYSGEDGKYALREEGFPMNRVDVVVSDTAGVYESDSVNVAVSFEGGTDGWNAGKATIQHDFQLKKK